MNKEYHVSKKGSDFNDGSINAPFLTIDKAAQTANYGDTVIVHEGTYREWVKPHNGGNDEQSRVVYKAANGEKVIIKGSEIIDNWQKVDSTVWKAVVDNKIFGDYNPYKEDLNGDWYMYPTDKSVHAGDVYLNGKSFYEAKSIEEVKTALIRTEYKPPLNARMEYLPHPEDSKYQYFADVQNETTTIYANFHDANPNEHLVEINVRECCFYPEKLHVNYITVSGFEMAHAACRWAPPTANQMAMLGPKWAKGWIIENNILHDAKCSAISIGKEASTGDMECTRFEHKPGYQTQLEAVFKALEIGWKKENIGSHIVRNNTIYDCGQNGIVGHLGCIYSEIYGNHIYNIGTKHEYFGYEIAAIKFHAPIDVRIHHNNLHDNTLGLWLDWQAQGTRVSCNLLYNNDRDCCIEVTHGPHIIDNNIFASKFNFDNHAQGGAYINNLCCGLMKKVKVLDRATPYHLAHSTQVAGYAFVEGGDDRLYNNVFVGGVKFDNEKEFCGTNGYNNNCINYEEYHEKIVAGGQFDKIKYDEVEQPVYINGNVYYNNAQHFKAEKNFCEQNNFNPNVKITNEADGTYLELEITQDMLDVKTQIQGTNTLGKPRIADVVFDDYKGENILFDTDYFAIKRTNNPTAGPFEGLKTGKNRIKVWG